MFRSRNWDVATLIGVSTPWKRIATYKVPNLPACPPGGCHCAWVWVPKGCGEPSMYMHGFKCKVTGAKSTTPLASAKPPVYCKDDRNKCVKGAKQMVVWHQAEGDNVFPPQSVSPGYNDAWGWASGAQSDIFEKSGATQPSSTSKASSSISPTLTNSYGMPTKR